MPTMPISQNKTNVLSTGKEDFKLNISTLDGIYFLSPSEILYCIANDNYTHFFLTGNRRLVSCTTLKRYDQILSPHGFLRIHKSNLINVRYVEKFSGYNSTILLQNNTTLEVSRRKKETVKNFLFNKNYN